MFNSYEPYEPGLVNLASPARMGSVRHNALNVTDQHGGLLATTEPMTSTGENREKTGSFHHGNIVTGWW